DDADAVAERIAAAGGALFMPPFDVMEFGRMTMAADAAGAPFGVWQGKAHAGAEVVNEPGAMTWNEIHTAKFEESKRFYTEVFGYRWTEMGDGDAFRYSTASLTDDAEAAIAGAYADANLPEGLDSYWLVWFTVADADAAAARI